MNKVIMLASVAILGSCTLVLGTPVSVHAQEDKKVSLDLREAPIREALKQLFDSVGVNYTLSSEVQGFVTLKVDDISFDQALRLILRNATIPLTYTKEGKIFIIKPRVIVQPQQLDPTANVEPAAPQAANYEVIQLRYLDPLQLVGLFGVIQVPQAAQMRGGGGMGGMGGGMGGMGGGMGGMGGGMMGGGGFGGGRGF
jgi:type II secretory pathway component GspD/PulD (secretin)